MRVRRALRVHGEQRERLTVAKPFPCGVLVRRFVRHAANQHGAPEIVHVGGNAHHLARGREAAVCRDNQLRRERLAALQCHARQIVIGFHRADFSRREQRHVAMLSRALPQRLVGSLANQVIGDQPAQLRVATQVVSDLERPRRGTIEHPGAAQRGTRVRVDEIPKPEPAHRAHRLLGQRDLAPVELRLADAGEALLLDHDDLEASTTERARETQPHRTGAHDYDICLHESNDWNVTQTA
ncbi:hypothetical protein NECAME_18124 [Necator americanus]|uniref:Uncharacterized protein n=1 Tax=Necator americanus TaxID=51031 RepID=W2TBI9_NECAM|nr:hypothetical protein NECAME_18124 [Necator americanus]ETN79400.1 hypothetical protein NECAME_18124 [Necator americanus]